MHKDTTNKSEYQSFTPVNPILNSEIGESEQQIASNNIQVPKRVRIPISALEKAIENNYVKDLAFFCLLKSQYNNSCIYSYKSRMDELSKSCGVCVKTLYNFLAKLKNLKLIHDHAGNLMLSSYRSMKRGRVKGVLIIEKSYRVEDIAALLYGKILERRGRNQAFMESMGRFERGDMHKTEHCENPFYPSMSFRTIAKSLKMTPTKAHRIIKRLCQLNFIIPHKQSPFLISENAPSAMYYIEDRLGYHFNIGSCLYEQFGDRYEFLHYPIYLKKISLNQYKAFKKNKREVSRRSIS